MRPLNPLLAWCRSYRLRRAGSPIRRPILSVESLETRCVPANFTISNFNDGAVGSGSLRSAIYQSDNNFQNQTNVITLNTGTYTLSLTGTNEDKAATGDLDITGTQTLTIQGQGAGLTIIDAKQIDRVFDVIGSGVNVTFKNLTIRGGYIEASPTYTTLHGGGILNEGGNVTLSGVTVTGNQLDGYIDTAGGGVASDSGTLSITNSTITGNTLGYASMFSGSLNGTNGARGDDSHPQGYNGTSGQAGPAGGLASGGGVFVRNTTATVTSSIISTNSITGGAGVGGGSGGAGGHSQHNATSLGFIGPGGGVIPGEMGGNAGSGAAGGSGGDANGAGVAADGGTLTITGVQITGNSATAGDGGAGGNGGDGGAYLGVAGAGGAGGKGGTAHGAVYAGGNAKLTINGTTTIKDNTATGGEGGQGGRSGTPGLGYVPNAGFAGPASSGAGGTGGLAAGAGLTIENGTTTAVVDGILIQSNTATGGMGGHGGDGSIGHDNFNSGVDVSIAGGRAADGGTGGDVHGAGVYFGNVPVALTNVTIKLNSALAGTGGHGGNGGNGGDGGTSLTGLGTGTPGAVGGHGGNAGNGGSANGGGLYVSGTSGASIFADTIANNSVTAGDGGNGGSGGNGGDGGYGLFVDGPGARGGDAGNGGSAGAASGGGVYGSVSVTPMLLANSTIAFNTMAGGTGGSGGGGGGGGSGHGGRAGGGSAGTSGGATTSLKGGGVDASGLVSISNDTVAYNDTGIYGENTSVFIANTISAKNTSLDIAGQFRTNGHDLFGVYNSTQASALAATDLRGSATTPLDPKLPTTLQNKGGKTDVLYPFSNSPAINAGGTTPLLADQRGITRTIGSAADIGSVEVATGYFSTSYSIPASGVVGANLQGTLTIVIDDNVGSSRVDLQACKLEYSIVSPK